MSAEFLRVDLNLDGPPHLQCVLENHKATNSVAAVQAISRPSPVSIKLGPKTTQELDWSAKRPDPDLKPRLNTQE